MDKQDTNKKSAVAGRQAALDAERVLIAVKVLPIAVVFSAL